VWTTRRTPRSRAHSESRHADAGQPLSISVSPSRKAETVCSGRPATERAISMRVTGPQTEVRNMASHEKGRDAIGDGRAPWCPFDLRRHSDGGFLNSWIAFALLRLSVYDTAMEWPSSLWQPSQVAWVGITRPLAIAASRSFMTLIFL